MAPVSPLRFHVGNRTLRLLRNATSAQRPNCGFKPGAYWRRHFEGVMRPESPASAVAASTTRTDAYALKRAIGRFLAVCKTEHLPPAEILVRFDAFLAKYNERQRRLLGGPLTGPVQRSESRASRASAP